MGALQSLAALVWAVPTSTLAWGMIISGLAAFTSLMLSERLTAPYGRCAAPPAVDAAACLSIGPPACRMDGLRAVLALHGAAHPLASAGTPRRGGAS